LQPAVCVFANTKQGEEGKYERTPIAGIAEAAVVESGVEKQEVGDCNGCFRDRVVEMTVEIEDAASDSLEEGPSWQFAPAVVFVISGYRGDERGECGYLVSQTVENNQCTESVFR